METGMKKYSLQERKFLVEFIALYKQLPTLWCMRSPDYLDRRKKREAYKILLEKYRTANPNATVDEVKRRINILRTNYRREYKKAMDRNTKNANSKNSYLYKPSLWYFDELSFLDKDGYRSSKEDLSGIEDTSIKDDWCIELHKFKYGLPCSESSEVNPQLIENASTEQMASDMHENIPTMEISNQFISSALNGETEIEEIPKKRRKKKKFSTSKAILTITQDLTKKFDDEYETLSKSWATKIRKMEPKQRLFAEKAINDILFEGQLGTLNRYSIAINSSSNVSTIPTSSSEH